MERWKRGGGGAGGGAKGVANILSYDQVLFVLSADPVWLTGRLTLTY